MISVRGQEREIREIEDEDARGVGREREGGRACEGLFLPDAKTWARIRTEYWDLLGCLLSPLKFSFAAGGRE
jgi:hypothetical protein